MNALIKEHSPEEYWLNGYKQNDCMEIEEGERRHEKACPIK
jgi:hypothetical protein